MRLIRQSFLWFKEGNSDKVYEIDLCEVGGGKYVVNFRYGRRGAVLKEATKTPVPVSLEEAEKIFHAVENEKLEKGYTATESSAGSQPATPAFSLNTAGLVADNSWITLATGREKAILQRLQQASVNAVNTRYPWKTPRVIWKAGTYKIAAAVPYILQLFDKGDKLQQYSAAWALARCGGTAAVDPLKQLFNSHPSPVIKKIAGAGLLLHLSGHELEAHLNHYLNGLPDDIKKLIDTEQFSSMEKRLGEQEPPLNWLEPLYLYSFSKKKGRPVIRRILEELPLKPGYFKQARGIYKLAELLDDYDIYALLACRLEREDPYFIHFLSAKDRLGKAELFIESLGEFFTPGVELKKANSRLAFSQKTKNYLVRRTRRKLKQLGVTENIDYVKLATGLLLHYENGKDHKEPFTSYKFGTVSGRYQRIEERHPAAAQAVFLHLIIEGHNPELQLMNNGRIWQYRDNQSARVVPDAPKSSGGFLQKIGSLFSKKKAAPELPVEQAPAPSGKLAFVPYLHLWNQLPQAYIQLLMNARMDGIHEFAHLALTSHPEYSQIKSRLDKEDCKKLLLSAFALPAELGYTISKEKFENGLPDDDLVLALLDSAHMPAREMGRGWTEKYSQPLFEQSRFIAGLLLARYSEIRSWGRDQISRQSLSDDLRMAVTGKVISGFMQFTGKSIDEEYCIREATENLMVLFSREIKETGLPVIADLIQHSHPAVLLAGLTFLKTRADKLRPEELTDDFIFSLLHHSYEPVREEGIALLKLQPASVLLQRKDGILQACLSSFENVRNQLAPLIQKMAEADRSFGIAAAEYLMPWLLRKETVDGLHASVSRLLCNELSNYLQNADKDRALHLLYSHYPAAQNVGVTILEKYTDNSQLTIPQVVALGGHENLAVREWCQRFYLGEIPRIRFEKETAIRLLDSKWEDSRNFAMKYFREQFREEDWDSQTLITLADSVKPEVEAFGRELITRFFHSDKGEEYLLKLSQHPSEKMQLFATHYLERFAENDPVKLQGLEFYFRSVLTRVNKSRVAKDRIYRFLLEEGRKSPEAAAIAGRILSDVSATAVAGDKSKCISVLLQLKALYALETPLQVKEMETRSS